MPLNQRAKIFTPFAALKGFEKLIALEEERMEEMPELSQDQYDRLNETVRMLCVDDLLTLRYYENGHIRTLTGRLKKLDRQRRFLIVDEKKIAFEDLMEMEV